MSRTRIPRLLACLVGVFLAFACASPPVAPKPPLDAPTSPAPSSLAPSQDSGAGPKSPNPSQASLPLAKEVYGPPKRGLSPGEADFLASYRQRVLWVVYWTPSPGVDRRLGKLGATQVSRCLSEKAGLRVLAYDQVETASGSIAEGGSAALARSLGADLALEVGFRLQGEQKDGRYYAAAPGSLRVYDPGSGSLLETLDFDGQPGLSPSSMEAAQTNAVASSAWAGTAKVLGQLKALAEASAARGLRYEVEIQGAWTAQAVEGLLASLGPQVLDLGLLEALPGKLRLYLYCLVDEEGLRSLVQAAARSASFSSPTFLPGQARSLVLRVGP